MFDKENAEKLFQKITELTKLLQKDNFKEVSKLKKITLQKYLLEFFNEIENLDTLPIDIQEETLKKMDQKPNNVLNKELQEDLVQKNKTASPILEFLQKIPDSKTVENQAKPESQKKEAIELKEKENISLSPSNIQENEALRDLRDIIDLNKSFILKAELFQQDNNLYNLFLDEINQTKTELIAFDLLKKWTTKLEWNTDENKAYDLLYRAIEKRFLPLIS